MEPQFWHDRWNANEIGFHEDTPHRLLQRHWPTARLAPDAHVLVPLCGKSPDLGWLSDLGYRVTGIELSEVAARDYFEHNRVTPEVEALGPFTEYRHDNLRILVGDFFEATAALIGSADAVYDRAALIALPPAMRERYVERLATLCGPGARIVLIALEYPMGAISAPPFPVDALEVTRRFGDWCNVAVAERIAASVKGIDGTEACYSLRVMAG
ncbi:MAG: thiopurine S-methyltransferase [Pseudomonadota bacterium]